MISLFYITMLPFRRKKVISQQRGTYITNGTLILKWLKASYLSKKTAVIHCWVHQVPSNDIVLGNVLLTRLLRRPANISNSPKLNLYLLWVPMTGPPSYEVVMKPRGWLFLQDRHCFLDLKQSPFWQVLTTLFTLGLYFSDSSNSSSSPSYSYHPRMLHLHSNLPTGGLAILSLQPNHGGEGQSSWGGWGGLADSHTCLLPKHTNILLW